MANAVSHKWRSFPIFLDIHIIVVLLVLSACSQPSSSSSSLSGHLLVVGSTALQPLTSLAATAFEKDHPQVHIEVRGGGSLFGLSAVTGQQADIGDSDVYADPTLYPDSNLIDHIICIVPFSMIMNPDVPLAFLTQQDIIGIFTLINCTIGVILTDQICLSFLSFAQTHLAHVLLSQSTCLVA